MYIRRIISPDMGQSALYVSLFHFLNIFFFQEERKTRTIAVVLFCFFNLKKLCQYFFLSLLVRFETNASLNSMWIALNSCTCRK